MTAPSTSNQEFWFEFIDLYKENSCLWDVHSTTYMRRDLRNAAYKVLLEKYREFVPEATLDMVKKKIDVFRTGYRREIRRINDSGIEYKPSLWYFDKLSFLDFQGECDVKELNEPDEQEHDVEYIEIPEDYPDPVVKYRLKKRNLDTKPRRRQKLYERETREQETPCDSRSLPSFSFESEEDDCAIYCASLKLQMRELDMQQKYIAQKLISDVIFLARTSQLTLDSSILISRSDNFSS